MLQRALAIVWRNINFATIHSGVTVGGCLVEHEDQLLRQFARVVAHRMPYTSVISDIAAGPHGLKKNSQFTMVLL